MPSSMFTQTVLIGINGRYIQIHAYDDIELEGEHESLREVEGEWEYGYYQDTFYTCMKLSKNIFLLHKNGRKVGDPMCGRMNIDE